MDVPATKFLLQDIMYCQRRIRPQSPPAINVKAKEKPAWQHQFSGITRHAALSGQHLMWRNT